MTEVVTPTTDELIEAKPVEAAARPSFAAAEPSPDFLRLIPHDFARRHLILSVGTARVEDADRAGTSNVTDDDHSANAPRPTELLHIAASTRPAPIHNVGVRLNRAILTEVVPAEALASAIDRAYAAARHATSADSSTAPRPDGAPPELALSITSLGQGGVEHELKALLAQADSDLLSTQGKAPLVRLVDLLLFEAVQRRASDIHVQPLADRTLIRYRLDGVLHTVRELPPMVLPAMVSRVKVMARLDVAEQRAPQDGRTTVTLGGGINDKTKFGNGSPSAPSNSSRPRRIDLRISTLPTTYGERVVIRLLDTAASPHLLNFAALGMPPEVERPLTHQLSRSSGIVLVTGPTGSGKTTTLYTALAHISTQRASSHTNYSSSTPPSSPLATHHSPLASSSPDLNIMTIEDPVEYDLSIAGLSISQTQLNSKKGVTFAAGLRHILRQDPDVIMVGEVRDEETAKVAVQASLTGHLVLSTLHTNDAASAVARLLDLNVEPFLVGSTLAAVLAQRLVRRVHIDCAGQGCEGCLHTGYRGRLGVFELLVLDAELREKVAARVPAAEIKSLALEKGLIDLKEAGRRLVAIGQTTSREISRVIEGVE